jgi:S1-C subfamily serine protease
MNLAGQVIGINTLVAGQAGPGIPAQGIGFAIAINTAHPIADQLVNTGRAPHPYLGVRFVPITPTIAVQLRLPVGTKGVVVGQVEPASPAARAGIQTADVILSVDGQPLAEESSLPKILNAHKPGDTIQLTINRSGQQITVSATLGDTPQR